MTNRAGGQGDKPGPEDMDSAYLGNGMACLILAGDALKVHRRVDGQHAVDSLESLESLARVWGMEATRVADWPAVDAALEAAYPVILMGDPTATRAHGRRFEMKGGGVNFLLLSKRVSTMFPTTGGPFATETVSYLAHDPNYAKGPVWLCLGELRGYCDAIPSHDVLGVSLKA
jgi:hypothetical protein